MADSPAGYMHLHAIRPPDVRTSKPPAFAGLMSSTAVL
jgi:hypothetical protein